MEVRVAGLLEKEGKLLLALHEKPTEAYWVLPGGHVDERETPEDALKREWEEELGLKIRSSLPLACGYTIGPSLHRLELFYRVEAKTEKLSIAEIADARFFSRKDLLSIHFKPRKLLPFLHHLKKRFQYLGNLFD